MDPTSARVLMRWHPRLERWMQVGGHADAGETDPWAIALREASEETGLRDLSPWSPDLGRTPVQLTIVGVPAAAQEPAHEHADMRYVFSTESPERALSETSDAPLRWSTIDRAIAETDEENLKEFLHRAERMLR
ncbi:MAG: NUDIX hydrolase [Actinomycetota bacterium]